MIAGGLAGRPGARLYCVDPFGADENPEYQSRYYAPLLSRMDRTLEQAFSDHISQSGLSSIAEAVRGYSFEIVQSWTIPIDLLFIDANHEYESVRRDFEQWESFVRIGGVIALHDASEFWPGPTRVRDEKFQPPKFDTFSQVDSLVWAVKTA
jgi:MMP 1-O-methyltransferase